MPPQLAMIDAREEHAAHPRGLGGVADAMDPDVLTFHPDMSAEDAAASLGRAGATRGIVTIGGRVIGIVTERDLAARPLPNLRVGDLMTPQTLTGRSDWPLALAVLTMDGRAVQDLPILNGRGDVVGILARGDLKLRLAPAMRETTPELQLQSD